MFRVALLGGLAARAAATVTATATATNTAAAAAARAAVVVVAPLQRPFSSAPVVHDLREFFPSGQAEEGATTGRRWHAKDLRTKSFEDLHKLWFVLLKERNMLLTVQQEARRLQRDLPRADRLRKVRLSMAAIKVVIGERERALAEAAEANPDVVGAARAALGVPQTPFVKPEAASLRVQSDAQHAQLLGTERMGLAPPGIPQRKMTKQERFIFRSELQARRAEKKAEERAAIQAQLDAMSPDEFKTALSQVHEELKGGSDLKDLSLRSAQIFREGKRRKLVSHAGQFL